MIRIDSMNLLNVSSADYATHAHAYHIQLKRHHATDQHNRKQKWNLANAATSQPHACMRMRCVSPLTFLFLTFTFISELLSRNCLISTLMEPKFSWKRPSLGPDIRSWKSNAAKHDERTHAAARLGEKQWMASKWQATTSATELTGGRECAW